MRFRVIKRFRSDAAFSLINFKSHFTFLFIIKIGCRQHAIAKKVPWNNYPILKCNGNQIAWRSFPIKWQPKELIHIIHARNGKHWRTSETKYTLVLFTFCLRNSLLPTQLPTALLYEINNSNRFKK